MVLIIRLLFFAYEDRQQIVDLFLETHKRLAVVYNVYHNTNFLPSKVWEKNDSIMTDASTKNLKIVELISKAFKNYILIHLFIF